MASVDMQDRVDRFDTFFRDYYEGRIAELAQHYPTEQRSLYVDWSDLYRFDEDLAEDVRGHPDQLVAEAEEALRLFDLPVDVSLGQAHVRFRDLPEPTDIRDIRAEHVNRLVAVRGIVRKATGVKPRIEETAFECQRCGTITRIPQDGGRFQEPHQCQACERKGPFRIDEGQSEFVDAQRLRIQESPEGLRGGQTPESIDIHVEDDATGLVSPGDSVRATGVLRLAQQRSGGEASTLFDIYMEGMSIEAEEEQFDEMDITEADEAEIVAMSESPEIYEQMVESIAPSIYGYENAKLAMVLQLFSGVTKKLPDSSRTRGDMHLLLIGDPGTGKCLAGDTTVTLADGTTHPIRDLVESNLTAPTPVDDGVYDDAQFAVPSLGPDGRISPQTVTRVWKREAPSHMYRIVTATGRELTVTPSHPLFIQRDGGFEPKRAADLDTGEFIAVPRGVETSTDNALDIPYRVSKAPDAVRLDLPDEWTPSLARLVGYIVADGYAELGDDNAGSVSITNNDRDVLDDIGWCFDRLGLPWTEAASHRGKSARVIRCTSGEVVSFLETLEPGILRRANRQRVPPAIQRAGPRIKAAFGRGYIEGDGTVAHTQGEISVGSMSEALLRGVRELLSSLEIQAQLHQRAGGGWRLRISGTDVDRYLQRIGFTSDRKTAMAREHDGTTANSNLDVVPELCGLLKRVRTSLRLNQFECGVPRSTYQHYERGDRDPSRESLRNIVATFEKRIEHLHEFSDPPGYAGWDRLPEIRKELRIAQAANAERADVTQRAVSSYERNEVAPDGGVVHDALGVIPEEVHRALAVEPDVQRLRRLVEADAGWDRIERIDRVETTDEWVYDLEVDDTHNYLSNGVVSHNSALLQYIRNIAPRSVYTSGKGSSAAGLTAAAVRDDFGDGQQWSLEAGALVLADRGVAAIDELDKMRPEDRSALHEGLEAQEISISKAGINATLKARCSLLGAANPQYGRFDPYEPMGEQIDLEPALISRFDLIFTITDQPDETEDRAMAEHILETNYAGELHTRKEKLRTPDVSDAEIDAVSRTVTPAIEPELFRKYVAFAQQSCYPRMSDGAREAIQEFYVSLRGRGADEDAPVPVTARKLEALVRLSEASARVRLSDTVDVEDAERVIELVRSCLQDIGVDPETGKYDADVIETGRSKTQRDRVRTLKDIIRELQAEHEDGAPREEVLAQAEAAGIERDKAEHQIQNLRDQGEVYSPQGEDLRLV